MSAANYFGLVFGLYVLALGIYGFFDPTSLFVLVNKVNPLPIPKLPEVGLDHQGFVITFALTSAVGFYYVFNHSIALWNRSETFAHSSVFGRLGFSAMLMYGVSVNRIDAGFIIFVLQDTLTSFISYILLDKKREGSAKRNSA